MTVYLDGNFTLILDQERRGREATSDVVRADETVSFYLVGDGFARCDFHRVIHSVLGRLLLGRWPVSLYVAFRGVLAIGLDRTAQGWRHQVFARLALLFFITFCYGYYRLCMAVGYAMAWGFLVGFLPALPFAVRATRVANPKRRWLIDGLSFVVYFWASGMIPGCKAAYGN
jgi:hypothetical protein